MRYKIRLIDCCDRTILNACESVLKSVPEWFPLKYDIKFYIEAVAKLPTFIATNDEEVVGFLSVKQHFPQSSDIYIIGVSQSHHGMGIGSALVEACEKWLLTKNCQFLQVKTHSASVADVYYERTLKFYKSVGFVPLEEISSIWGEKTPCLLMIKHLTSK